MAETTEKNEQSEHYPVSGGKVEKLKYEIEHGWHSEPSKASTFDSYWESQRIPGPYSYL